MGCVVPNFFYYDQMKKHKGLSHYPPTPHYALGEPDWKRNLIWNGQKSEQDTLHHCEVPRFSEMPHSSPVLSLVCTTLSLCFFPQLSLSLSIASSPSSPPPQHLPVLTPDTVPPLRFHPFPTQPACCGGCVVVLSY